MLEPAWFESFFGPDYFEIYRDVFSPEASAGEAEGIGALLALAPGARVLDLACGHGRHAIPLAARGLRVTATDLSETMLARAQREAAARGVSVRCLRSDMRALPFEAAFDAVINVFTAFGYFADEADDLAALRGVHRALRPGARFLLETLHRDGLVARFQPRVEYTTSGGAHVIRDYVWDAARDVIEDRVELRRADGTQARYSTSLRMRTLREWLALLRQAGLEPVAWHGGLDGRPLERESRRVVLIAARPGRAPAP